MKSHRTMHVAQPVVGRALSRARVLASACALLVACALVSAARAASATALAQGPAPAAAPRLNVLLVISDDLTATALSCYGNEVCETPHIDALAARGTRFTRAYCQGTYCGPSRAALLSGYYPHATGVLGYDSPRKAIGERATWPGHFKDAGYHTARISKVFHMGVPGGIEAGSDGADDPRSWSERYNSQGPEWQAPGDGETLEGNRGGQKPVVGGNTFVVVEADGDDLVHSDGKTAAKAVELLGELARRARGGAGEPFFLAVGFVRPHVPFVAPRAYFAPFLPYSKLALPKKHANDLASNWKDTPKAGVNYKTSQNMQMDERQQKKALGGYYACVRFVDAQVGKVMAALREQGLEEQTIVIFTSDHGYHLGEHDFWAKVSLRDESAQVPLIVCVPGKAPAVCESLVELQDLFPTTASLCGLEVPARIQGHDLTALLDDSKARVRDMAFSVAPMREGFLVREKRWAYIQYGEDGSKGRELYDTLKDPQQFTNLAGDKRYEKEVARLSERLAEKLREVRDTDLAK
ncbi:MAG: sulfatase [Planctomycetota bacterium]